MTTNLSLMYEVSILFDETYIYVKVDRNGHAGASISVSSKLRAALDVFTFYNGSMAHQRGGPL